MDVDPDPKGEDSTVVVLPRCDGLADLFLVSLANGGHAVSEEEHNGQHPAGGFLLCGCLQGIVNIGSTTDPDT